MRADVVPPAAAVGRVVLAEEADAEHRPTTIWVVDTGRPSCEATSTVNAADSATQKARIGFILVICSPTMRTMRGPNRNRPRLMPTAPISITQNGTPTLACQRAGRRAVEDRRERSDGVGHVVRAMSEGEQRRRADQRQMEQLPQSLIAVLHAGRLAAHPRLRREIDQSEDQNGDRGERGKLRLPHMAASPLTRR